MSTFQLVSRGVGPFRLRYRPRRLEELVATCPLPLLRKCIAEQSRVVLLEGGSGTGKSTCAYILAQAAICQASVAERPCLTCLPCQQYDGGAFLADIEKINAANANKVDDVRSLVAQFRSLPMYLPKRLIILDEVQRLTKDSQQVLLTEIEDLPAHLVLILCTTNVSELSKPLVDRTTRISFRDLSSEQAVEVTTQVAKLEGQVAPTGDLLRSLVAAAQGSVRALLNELERHWNGGASGLAVDGEAAPDARALYAVLASGKWESVAEILATPEVKADPDTLRFAVACYARGVLLGGKRSAGAAVILEHLHGWAVGHPYNELVLRCWRAIQSSRGT